MLPTKALMKQNQGVKLHQLFLKENALLQKQSFVVFFPQAGMGINPMFERVTSEGIKGQKEIWGF